jgi:hypothetical protein
MKDTSYFHLKGGGERSLTLIVIDMLCPWITHLG